MSENAAHRAVRLLDLVPYLTANPGISVKELAKTFEVTSSEIIKDLDLLFLCGLPGYTPLELIDLSVDDGFVTVRDPQNLAVPRKFSEEEALTLRIALAALEDILPIERRSSVRQLRQKIAALFNSEVPESALFFEGDSLAESVKLIREALLKSKRISFSYKNLIKGEVTQRELSISAVIVERSRTLIEGWDHTVNGKRTFQLSQMQDIRILETGAQSVSEENVGSIMQAQLSGSPDSFFFRENQALLKTLAPGTVQLDLFQPEWLIRSVLAEAGAIRVEEPASIRQRVRQIAQSALRNY